MAFRRYLVQEIALDCADGLVGRREALRRLGLLGVAGAAATALLSACGDDGDSQGSDPSGSSGPPGPTSAATSGPSTTPTDTGGVPSTSGTDQPGEEIRFAGANTELIGVFAEAAPANGAVLVIHENRGLTSHIRSIPARLAADGYSALAIDLLSSEGGTAGLPSEGDATAALGNAPVDRLVADLRAGLDELERRVPGAQLAVIGFCFGGAMTWQLLAAGEPRIAAAVPFYGPLPDGADFAGSPSAAVLGIYAGLDDRVNASREAAEAALLAAGLEHELQTFDGVDHAFFNDTGPRYDAAAATAAYQTMLDWFGRHLAVR